MSEVLQLPKPNKGEEMNLMKLMYVTTPSLCKVVLKYFGTYHTGPMQQFENKLSDTDTCCQGLKIIFGESLGMLPKC